PDRVPTGGGSDDIGDVMWTVPTSIIRFPSHVPGAIFHHVTGAIGIATPIAHKGAVNRAKVVAMALLELMMDPQLLASTTHYFENVQLKDVTYDPVLTSEDSPGIHLNNDATDIYRPQMEEFYYDPERYDSYL